MSRNWPVQLDSPAPPGHSRPEGEPTSRWRGTASHSSAEVQFEVSGHPWLVHSFQGRSATSGTAYAVLPREVVLHYGREGYEPWRILSIVVSGPAALRQNGHWHEPGTGSRKLSVSFSYGAAPFGTEPDHNGGLPPWLADLVETWRPRWNA